MREMRQQRTSLILSWIPQHQRQSSAVGTRTKVLGAALHALEGEPRHLRRSIHGLGRQSLAARLESDCKHSVHRQIYSSRSGKRDRNAYFPSASGISRGARDGQFPFCGLGRYDPGCQSRPPPPSQDLHRRLLLGWCQEGSLQRHPEKRDRPRNFQTMRSYIRRLDICHVRKSPHPPRDPHLHYSRSLGGLQREGLHGAQIHTRDEELGKTYAEPTPVRSCKRT